MSDPIATPAGDPLSPGDKLNALDLAFRHGVHWAWALIALSAFGLAVFMRLTGRIWWCGCGTWTPWSSGTGSRHNSQHLIDPYTTSHILHGVIFYFLVTWLFPKLPTAWRLFISVTIEVAWEAIENSPVIIDRYRAGTAAIGYEGDSIVNSLSDLASAVLGFYLARRVGWRWSVAIYVVVELAMLYAIRDNLTLNVIMLLYPIDAIRQWQLGRG